MATSTEKGSAPTSRKRNFALFFLLALGLAGIVAGGYYYLSKKEGSATPVAKVEEPIFISLDPFTVNLQPNGRSRFLHVAVTLKMTDAQSQMRLTQYAPEVRSRVLNMLSNRTADSLLSTDDKAALTADILAALNQPFAANQLPQKIASVMFTTFMLQ